MKNEMNTLQTAVEDRRYGEAHKLADDLCYRISKIGYDARFAAFRGCKTISICANGIPQSTIDRIQLLNSYCIKDPV